MIQRRGSPFLNQKRITLLAIFFVSLISVLYTPIRSRLTQALYSVAPSFFSIGSGLTNTGSSFTANFRDKQTLVYENAMLRAENGRMQAQVLDRNLLQERVMKLEESLGRPRNDNRVVADVISGLGQSLYDNLIIDAGSDQGIKNGNFVVYAGAGIVGDVAEVMPVSAKVRLFSSPGEEYSVLIGARSIPATAKGKGDGNFEAKVAEGSTIVPGDRVIVSKGNLILGTVDSVEQKPGVPFATVFFRSSFNPTEIRTVEVIVGTR